MTPADLDTLEARASAMLAAGSATAHVSAADLLALVAAARDRDRLRGAMSTQDERNLAATRRCGIEPCGCDTPDRLADEVLALRAECARLHAALDAPTEKTP